jgi:regulator of CtrA degradation
MDTGLSNISVAEGVLTPRLVSALYIEAMLLADEVRTYFDETGREERDSLAPLQRVSFSCESLKVTTRLMHIIAWLLTWRAVEAGEITAAQAREPSRRLGQAADSGEVMVAALPEKARALINVSRDLYERVARLDSGLAPDLESISPARALMDRLESAF